MDNRVKEMLEFLDSAHSAYHATAALVWELEAAGYTCLAESEKWNLEAGGKYYMTRSSSTIIAFRVPEKTPKGFMMSASHTDRPTFKYKGGGEIVDKYTKMGIEKYGGPIMNTWLDRPLSLTFISVKYDSSSGIHSLKNLSAISLEFLTDIRVLLVSKSVSKYTE